LSGVAGYVDAAGLLALAAMFPAHITGELVTEAVALSVSHRSTEPARLWMLPAFMGAVALAAVVARLERRAERSPTPVLLGLITLGLVGFGASGVVTLLWPTHAALSLRLGAIAAVAAMGFQNALMREVLNGSAPTTFMTGNLTQLVIELVDHCFAWARKPGILGDVERTVSRARLRTATIALSAFLGSAAVGALTTRTVGAVSALVPALAVGWLAAQALRERGVPRAAQHHAPATMGMRRPTPIQRPLLTHARPVSGTRFKAVRPVVVLKKAGDESG
jgi:uncharacterized membrane protein YoaK (UPF0700 family)